MYFIKRTIAILNAIFVILSVFILQHVKAQNYDCAFKAPLLTIDFGTGRNITGLKVAALPKYRQALSTCPADGNYSFVSHTSGCFYGEWLTFNEDHTLNDTDGKMMLVNASVTGGIFFNFIINGLSGNTTYQFATWLVNVCGISGNCPPLPPNIRITLVTNNGLKVAEFNTGLLSQRATPQWKKYAGVFTTPPGLTALKLIMEDITIGGCGNDFALDDITIRECIKPTFYTEPVIKKIEKPLVKKQAPVFPIEKKSTVKPPPVKQNVPSATVKTNTAVEKSTKPVLSAPVITAPAINNKTSITTLPQLIITRENPIIKEIIAAGEISIDLYDNGQIDGDTVSIYHNNVLMVSKAGLAEKPISLTIRVDAMHPHHELTMVANNLGSIPPNTSLMIVTAKDKRYEIFISSSEQKNAKVVINLKE